MRCHFIMRILEKFFFITPFAQFLLVIIFLSDPRESSAESKYIDGRPAATMRLDTQDVGVVLKHGSGPNGCDIFGAREAIVYEFDGEYYMHYDGAGEIGWLACLATSKNLTEWNLHGPILDLGAEGKSDSATATSPWVIKEDDRWHMFYLGSPNASPPPDRCPAFPYLTMKATSNSPRGPWRKQYDVVPFSIKPDTYYSATASPGHLVKQGEEYIMFFSASTRHPDVKRTISIARTKDLDSAWSVSEKPILPLEEQIENSSLYYEESNGLWYLFTNHIGINAAGQEYTDAVWAYWTDDLFKWNPENKAVVLDGENCSWSQYCIGMPSVVKRGNRLAILYDAPGRDSLHHMHRDIGLAWLDLPIEPITTGN